MVCPPCRSERTSRGRLAARRALILAERCSPATPRHSHPGAVRPGETLRFGTETAINRAAMRTLDQLIEAVQREAERAEFPVDRPVYERAKKDPLRPILFAGSLDAP